ncbi:hypothetical protein B0I29_115227 [Actinoplanes lutulentus]|uniref:TetR family transcriptional regulator n=2 Tax=Actinoplanes lutulentus TaxID=1287878 RepID=A0A327Z7Y0_9ACTN|nr:hypothetical protein B0I29_115227 [Actinoplanes lutulentus]
MFRTNPTLRALTSVQNEEAARVVVSALAQEIGVADDHPATRIAFGAILGAFQECELLPDPAAGAEARQSMYAFLQAGLAALKTQVAGR